MGDDPQLVITYGLTIKPEKVTPEFRLYVTAIPYMPWVHGIVIDEKR